MIIHTGMRLHISAVLILCLCVVTAFGQTPLQTAAPPQAAQIPYRITYRLSMPRPESHLFEVEIEVEAGGPVEFMDFQMPRWSPGRYAVYDFAKNVQEFRGGICQTFKVKCEAVSALVTRLDTQTWRVHMRKSQAVRVSYKIFADNLSGTFSQLDERHANFNGAAVFMYIVDHKQDSVRLKITPPAKEWRIINGRMDALDQQEWQFPNYDILIDTPTEIAPDWTMDQFKVDGKTYRVVVHSFADEGGKRPQLVRDIEKIVRAETEMWGGPDFDRYTFLLHFAPNNESGGDGMEHLTSTQIIETNALAASGVYEDTLGTVAHEFFHVWNVKRLRPAELGPWDFTRPVNTRALWIAEGITNYYGYLMLRRAKVWTDEKLIDAFSETITQVENAPGSRLISAEEASVIASFIDRTPHGQRTNLARTAVSYYLKGELLGLVLDLLIRGKTKGARSLDDVMRRMYEEFYLRSPNATYYLRGRGYTNEDFARVTSEVAGADLQDFFSRYVRSVETPPYDEAFAYVGLRLVRRPRGEPDKTTSAPEGEDVQSLSDYRIEEDPKASPEARAARAAWLNGQPR
ncbi:MAG: M61 family metallopeptidase [Pyrinomonadaceae bacterium]|nr:M61 family metallopeptidase [Pyrinomonadaceae bacterium]